MTEKLMIALSLRHVSKRFAQVPAVDSLSLQVERGWMYGLLGPNGAGKTTTIRMILNIIRPDQGQISLWGARERSLTDRVGYLPEERGLYRKMKVVDLLLFLAALKGMATREARLEVHRWLEKLGLSAWEKKNLEELSKGMQQQIQFIACVLHKPDLIIFDEPFTGLDPLNTNRLKDIILELNGGGATILLSTHRMEQVEKLCSHICLINRGRKVLDGPLSEIKREYGRNTVRLEYDGPSTFLENSPLIDKMDLYGHYAELRLRPSTDPQELLKAAVQTTRVRKFEIVEPSLEDIFIEKVAAETEEK
jgi:ABC-2 type transport system ATP-binding protein